jgi:hypothetical protein
VVFIALCSSLIGAALGTQYRVPVLLPFAGMGFAIVSAVAVIKATPILTVMTALGVWVICLQFGYLGGLLTRFCLEATGLAPHRSLHSTIVRH